MDRNNIVIASNYNTYDLFLIPEQTFNIEETLNKLSKIIKIDFKTKRKVIELSKKVKKFQRIKILKKISWNDLETIESQKYASKESREGHVNCKSGEELRESLKQYFVNVFIFSMNDELVHTGYTPMAHYLIGLCCGIIRR